MHDLTPCEISPAMPDFLELPERPAKPQAEGLMSSAGEYVDLVRLGWGSAYVTRDLSVKLDTYRAAGVPVMLGGTLTELAWLHGRVDALRSWLGELGIEDVEVSSGTVQIPEEEKLGLIE